MNWITLFLLFFIPVLQDGRIRPSMDPNTLFEQHTLPLKLNPGHWVSLEALKTADENFTLFADADFASIQNAYLIEDLELVVKALKKAYRVLENKSYLLTNQERITFPSLSKLTVESIYLQFPWIPTILTLAFLSLVIPRLSMFLTCSAFLFQTALLLMRIIILERPAVSSMYETLLFVPWVALALCLLLFFIYRHPLLLMGGNLLQLSFFSIIYLTDQSSHLDPIQPVLNSNFWLSIHVLLVVASYGIFAVGSVLGHALLLKRSDLFETILVNVLYAGLIALTAGTLLGGVWAAQSWGRFWDWDPKESWAFVSLSFYLVAVHLYRFNKIGGQGLAFGAIGGFLAITFCWYGVNYIIGTGMHSYGFGTGGLIYYCSFIAIECLFLIFALTTMEKTKIVRRKLRKG